MWYWLMVNNANLALSSSQKLLPGSLQYLSKHKFWELVTFFHLVSEGYVIIQQYDI